MAHHNTSFDPNAENFTFGGRLKTLSIVFMLIGVLGMIWAYASSAEGTHHARFWTNILTNAYYFNGIAIVAMMMISAHTIGYGAWQTIIKRLFEAFGIYTWVTLVFFLFIIAGIFLDWHGLYHHWVHPATGDTIVGDKQAFLNPMTYTIGVLLFFLGWIGIGAYMRKHSLDEDGATNSIEHYQKSKYIAAAYLVLFGISSSVFSWWAVMSTDPHWYSTLFGWYNFASYMCGMLSMMILVISYLKYKGHLRNVTENHLHSIGTYLFGFSVFWTYLWFSQFMLIWYGNIPEDTMYYVKRFRVPLFKVLFFVNLFFNFVFPFLFLMKRKAKRSLLTAGFASCVLICSHFLDFYLMVTPEPSAPVEHHDAAAKEHHASNNNASVLLASNETHNETGHAATNPAHGNVSDANHHKGEHKTNGTHEEGLVLTHASFGLIEVFIFLGFFGSFLFVVLTRLSKNRLVPINHPLLEESLRNQI